MNILFTLMANKNSRWVPKIKKVVIQIIGTTTVRTRPVKKRVSYFNFLLKTRTIRRTSSPFLITSMSTNRHSKVSVSDKKVTISSCLYN